MSNHGLFNQWGDQTETNRYTKPYLLQLITASLILSFFFLVFYKPDKNTSKIIRQLRRFEEILANAFSLGYLINCSQKNYLNFKKKIFGNAWLGGGR